jgi:tetratricopeptide (TPR) repeat protein
MKKVLLILALFILSMPASAQRWQWPDAPKNLTVLPKTTGGKDLQKVMFSFTSGLGVRCAFCHVGEEGQDISQYDFASDSKPEKNEARVMMQMVNADNAEYLSKLTVDSTSSMRVSCMTCHHGNAMPLLLEDKLKRTFDRYGIDSTLHQYHTLRDQYYGGFTYNFKEGTLVRLAEEIAMDSTKADAAVAVLKLNIELYPEYAFSYARLAGIYESQGNVQAAVDNYTKALKLDPRNGMARMRLEKLQGKQ